jgi:hypothetical protein
MLINTQKKNNREKNTKNVYLGICKQKKTLETKTETKLSV